jgi:hypothetical protein
MRQERRAACVAIRSKVCALELEHSRRTCYEMYPRSALPPCARAPRCASRTRRPRRHRPRCRCPACGCVRRVPDKASGDLWQKVRVRGAIAVPVVLQPRVVSAAGRCGHGRHRCPDGADSPSIRLSHASRASCGSHSPGRQHIRITSSSAPPPQRRDDDHLSRCRGVSASCSGLMRLQPQWLRCRPCSRAPTAKSFPWSSRATVRIAVTHAHAPQVARLVCAPVHRRTHGAHRRAASGDGPPDGSALRGSARQPSARRRSGGRRQLVSARVRGAVPRGPSECATQRDRRQQAPTR